jgi:hypothetical protein
VPRSLSAPIAFVLLTSAAGCVHLHRAEVAGDSARAAGDHAAAAKAYNEALHEPTDEVYGYEKDRIWPKYTEMAVEELRTQLKAPRRGSPHANVEDLIKMRSRVRDERLGSAIEREIKDAIDAEAMRALPEIEAAAKANRYGEAMSLATFYAGAVSAKHPLRARVQTLGSEAIAFHRGRSSAASGVGERLLHSRIAQAFGAPVNQRAETAVRAAAGVAWTVDTKDSSCPYLDRGLTRAIGSNVGAPGTIVLRLSCATSRHESSGQESYSYEATETYTTVEEQGRVVAVAGQSSYSVECPPGKINGMPKPCVGVEKRGPNDYKVEHSEVLVTRERTVERTGLRYVRRVRYTTEVKGEIAASARATGPDENVVFTLPASFTEHVARAEWDVPVPRVIPSDFGPGDAEEAALQKAIVIVRALLSTMQEGRAIPYVKEGEAAALAGDQATAEDRFMIAADIIERPDPAFASLLLKAYGFSPDDARRAVFGARLDNVAPPDSPLSDEPRSFEETARRLDWDYDLLLKYLVNPDAGPQPGRQAVGGSLRMGTTVFTRFQESMWGFGYYDQAWAELFLGGRTAGFTDSAGLEESSFSIAFELGYRPYLGYRTGQWGVFLGGRGHAILQAVGAMGQSGAILALAGAFEWRTAGPGVVTLSAWATPASTGQRTLGLDLVLPVGRTVGGVRLAFEKRTLSTAIPRMIEGDTFDDIGERDSISISLGLTASGDWVGSD